MAGFASHKVISYRPSTSHGRLPSNLPPVQRHQPPSHILPPYPPPPTQIVSSSAILSTLPELSSKCPFQRRVYSRRSSSNSISLNAKGIKIDVSVDTSDLQTNIRYICRLCGLDCLSGNCLHAHLLLLQHTTLSCRDIRLKCRQCGASWSLESDEKRIINHPCLLQKASFFKNCLAPAKNIRMGLPFVCLFCCTDYGYLIKKEGSSRRLPRSRSMRRKVVPLKRCQAASRFSSKLELAVHIRYAHDITRQSGRCIECKDFVCEEQERPEFEFWEIPEISQSRPPSTESILYQDGLHPLESHIQEIHVESFEYLQWLNSKCNRGGPKNLAEKTLKSRSAWMYACPLCQLESPSNHTSKDFKAIHPDVGLPSNSSLQAHIACFHSAGSNYIDCKLRSCSICGDLNAAMDHKHLLTRGHLTPFKRNFSQALKHGRFATVDGAEDVEWRNTCVLCWRRFGERGKLDLRAECRLQAHLLSTHCIFNAGCGGEFNVFACGWCGALRRKDEKKPKWMEGELFSRFLFVIRF